MKTNFKFLSLITALVIIALLNVKCKSTPTEDVIIPDEPKPTAGFVAIKPDSAKFKEYAFTNSSTNYTQFLWQFGDDETSTEENPKHTYKFAGKYIVTLTTRNGQGYSAKKEMYLNVVDPNFDATKCGENFIATIGGKYSVNMDAGAGADSGEGSKKLVDQNITTKFLQSGFDGTQRCTFELNTPQVVGAYTMTSGNDAAGRDPKQWFLQGSNDGIQFTTLHTVTVCPWENISDINARPTSRRQTLLFHFDNEVAYKYYRLHIKQIRSGNVFQLSEWTINKKQP